MTYIVIGALTRVIHGADEITRRIDFASSTMPENLSRLDRAGSDRRVPSRAL